MTKFDVFEKMKIKKGDFIADFFVPYDELRTFRGTMEDAIRCGESMVREKFTRCGRVVGDIDIYNNVEIDSKVGVYFIGVCK